MSNKLTPLDRASKFISNLRSFGIVLDDLDVVGINDAFVKSYSGNDIRAKYNVPRRLMDMFLYDPVRSNKNYYDRLVKTNMRGLTEEKMILRYGETEGRKRWKEYCEKQAYTNSFEYKNLKYGMTKEDFDRYNKSRSATEENFIKRHGEIEGKILWEKYRTRQAYAGCKLEYFIEKYGFTDGVKIYNDVVRKKRHTLDSVMYRNNCTKEEAIKWLDEYNRNVCNKEMFSENSQRFIRDILNALDLSGYKLYYGETEYGKWSELLMKYVKYDFTIYELGIIFEYDGDYFHANPTKYSPDDVISITRNNKKIAKDIWLFDSLKEKTAIDFGFEVCRIWESDYLNNRQDVIERCVNKIKEKIDEHNRKDK